MKSRKWNLAVLAILVLGIVTLLPAVAAADGAHPHPQAQPTISSTKVQGQQQQSFPGRYRQKGVYRGSENSHQTWQPSYYHQKKYYQVKPMTPFTGNLSRSTYDFNAGGAFYSFAPIVPYPGYVVYQTPVQYVEPEPAPPPPPPVTQVYIVQPPPPVPAPAPAAPSPPAAPEPPASKDPGKVAFAVHPGDAKVYLDDRLLGDGRSLVDKGSLKLSPGVYVLEVEHPRYEAQRLIFGVTANETTQVAIDLTSERGRRRSRVRTGDEIF